MLCLLLRKCRNAQFGTALACRIEGRFGLSRILYLTRHIFSSSICIGPLHFPPTRSIHAQIASLPVRPALKPHSDIEARSIEPGLSSKRCLTCHRRGRIALRGLYLRTPMVNLRAASAIPKADRGSQLNRFKPGFSLMRPAAHHSQWFAAIHPLPASTPTISYRRLHMHISSSQNRPAILCPHCQLIQFPTATGLCRRCRRSFGMPHLRPRTSSSEQPNTNLTSDRLARKIGATVRSLRRNRRLSQTRLAGAMGITAHSYISKLERGLVVPSILTLARISFALGIDIGEFVLHLRCEGSESVPSPTGQGKRQQ
jgi:ribosome-binding protein aMBF1 (putative translation factor)